MVAMVNAKTSGFEDLIPGNIGKTIRLVGIIGGKQKSEMTATMVIYKCNDCSQKTLVTEEIWNPCSIAKCKDCGSKSLHVLSDELDFHRYQVARLVELPEHVNGLSQRQVDVILTREQTDHKVGERIIIEGTIRERPKGRMHYAWKQVSGELAVFVENVEPYKLELEQERIGEIEDFVKEINGNAMTYYDQLAKEVFPRLEGADHVKRALLLAMIGGAVKGTDRKLIHVLLVGDPGVPMTSMLASLSKLNRRYAYVGQGGASNVGLTARVVKEDGNIMLESGVIPLTDGGSVVIDEIEKMREGDISALHEQMTTGKITANKWGIHETLDANTSIIAGTKHEKEIPDVILDRFDIVLPVENDQGDKFTHHDNEFVADLIHHAKTSVETVEIPEDIMKEIERRMTETGKGEIRRVMLFHSLQRLVTASARGRLHGKADGSDLELAWSILTIGRKGDHPWNEHPLNYWTKEDDAYLQEMKKKQRQEERDKDDA